MQFHFSYKQSEKSDALETYAESKLRDKIAKFVTKPIETHVVFTVDRHRHTAQCRLKAGDGFNVDVQHSCGDMYGSVDRMVDKLETQLKRQKEKLKTHNIKDRAVGRRPDPQVVAIEAELDSEPVDADDIIKYERARRKMAANS